MTAKAGEKAQRTGDFKCSKCGEKTHVRNGQEIPKCPKCGSTEYVTRTNEPGNK